MVLDRIKQCTSPRRIIAGVFCSVLIAGCALDLHANDDLSDALSAIKAVEPNGVGNAAAVKAMKALNSAKVDQIPEILAAMDGANQIATNWFRSAVVSVVGQGGEIPRDQIQAFFDDKTHGPMSRLLAFDLLTDGDPNLVASIVPTLIDDPSMPLRSKAVALLMTQADEVLEDDPEVAIGKLGQAMRNARDVGQLQSIAEKLNGLGVKVDLQKQMGFLSTWHLVGSFDNKEMAGFDVAYGPEEALGMIDLAATYKDLESQDANWQQVTTLHPTGSVDLNSLIGKVKGATVYAYGKFTGPEEREAEIRIGTPNATKIWLNGELVMENEIYHNSNSIDKFTGKVKLKKGENQILIKVCQNEQTEPWAQDWQFQLRICDETGKPVEAPSPAAGR